MQITFLGSGTSHGVPMIGCTCQVCSSADARDQRLRSSVLIHTSSKQAILIDAGTDLRQQLLRAKATYINAILLSHEHKDHIGGLDDIRALNYFMHCSIPIYALHRVLNVIRSDYAYAFAKDRCQGLPQMTLHPIESQPFNIGQTAIIPLPGLHNKLPVLGFRIGSAAYITDMNHLPTATLKLLHGCQALIINALRIEPHPSHFCLNDALAIISQVNPQQAYLTHISHQLGLHAQVQASLPPNVSLAYDGLIVEATP